MNALPQDSGISYTTLVQHFTRGPVCLFSQAHFCAAGMHGQWAASFLGARRQQGRHDFCRLLHAVRTFAHIRQNFRPFNRLQEARIYIGGEAPVAVGMGKRPDNATIKTNADYKASQPQRQRRWQQHLMDKMIATAIYSVAVHRNAD